MSYKNAYKVIMDRDGTQTNVLFEDPTEAWTYYEKAVESGTFDLVELWKVDYYDYYIKTLAQWMPEMG